MATDCAVCKLIRSYLYFAAPLVALIAASTMPGGEGIRVWFAKVELIGVLSWGCLSGMVILVCYRAYQEFYKPWRARQQLESKLQAFDRQSAGADNGKESG